MKTSTAAISALSLATVAIAQPSGHRRHQHFHERRQVVDTVIDVVTNTMPDVIVYVDSNGNILSSGVAGQVSTPTPSSYVSSAPASSYAQPTSSSVYVPPPSSSSSVYVAPSSSSVYVAPSSSAIKVAQDNVYVASSSSSVYVAPTTSSSVYVSSSSSVVSSSSTSSAAAASSSSASGLSGYGITYSPYLDNGDCKTADQVAGDFESISGYDFVRSYGTDCNQVSTILAACKSKGMKLMLGIYDITSVSDDIATIIAAVEDWSYIHTIAIGNEGVNDGTYTVSAVVAAIELARSLLGVTDFAGSLVTVDTFVATIANPELCTASDYAAVNCHPFFDGSVAAEDAGTWLLEQMDRVSSACSGKNTWITETGWPTKGDTNGKAIPGTSEQQAALASMKEKVSSNIVFFNAFNDYWKSDSSSTYGAEKYWGIYGSSKYSTDSE